MDEHWTCGQLGALLDELDMSTLCDVCQFNDNGVCVVIGGPIGDVVIVDCGNHIPNMVHIDTPSHSIVGVMV